MSTTRPMSDSEVAAARRVIRARFEHWHERRAASVDAPRADWRQPSTWHVPEHGLYDSSTLVDAPRVLDSIDGICADAESTRELATLIVDYAALSPAADEEGRAAPDDFVYSMS